MPGFQKNPEALFPEVIEKMQTYRLTWAVN